MSAAPLLPELGERGLFRTVPTSSVLHSAAAVFAEQLSRGASRSSFAARPGVVATDGDLVSPDEPEPHREADRVWDAARPSLTADAFISHVWVASRYLKYLTILHHTNGTVAIWIMLLSALCAFGVPLARYGFDITAANFYLDSLFFFKCVLGPTLAFFAAFFLAHLSGALDQQLWLDKLCIHQTRDGLKKQGVSKINEFVAQSDRMLILWSDTYFERLWCMCELGIFGQLHGVDAIDFRPLWLPPFILGGQICSLIFITLAMAFTAAGFENAVAAWAATHLGDDLAQVFMVSMIIFLGNLPGVPLYTILFRYKLRCSTMMLAQLDQFSQAPQPTPF